MNEEITLSAHEYSRYSRHFLLPEFTPEHQLKIKRAAAVIVGVGGLGNIVAQQLAAVGIGKLTLVDFDTIEVSNLARQVLFGDRDLHKNKAAVAAEYLKKKFPLSNIVSVQQAIDAANGYAICDGHTILIDCSDRESVKFHLDTIARQLHVPIVHGAVNRFDGQVAVFHGKQGASYIDWFQTNRQPGEEENCQTMGVWAPAASIVGSIMAQETLNLLAFKRSGLDGKLLQIDLKSYSFTTFRLPETAASPNAQAAALPKTIHRIVQSELAAFKAMHPDSITIDLSGNPPGIDIPIDRSLSIEEVMWESADWDKNRPIVMVCAFGFKSMQAAMLLHEQGFQRVYTLQTESE